MRHHSAHGLMWLALAACGADELDPTAPIDAARIDAAVPGDPDAAERGVRCGPSMVLCDPQGTLGCCAPADAGASVCLQPSGFCDGDLTSCDGPEDCAGGGDGCCDYGFGPACGAAADCTAKLGGTVVCHGDAQCPGAAPHCCAGRCAVAGCE